MKIRRKTLILIGLTSIIVIMTLHFTSQTMLMNSFLTLEKEDTCENVERVLSALSADLANLDASACDWAAWDDTYAFIHDKNEAYIESNLVEGTFSNLELNIMIFTKPSGEVVFGRGFDLETEEYTPIPSGIMEQLTPNNKLLQHQDTESSVTGIILLPENPILIASRPILTSSYEGPILGTLIMGYYLDSTRINDLAERTHLSIEIQRLDDSQVPADIQEAISSLTDEDPIFTKPLNSKSIAGYAKIDDIYGEPKVAMRVELPRSIYEQGQDTIVYFAVLLLTTSIIFIVVIVIGLEKAVLSRLAQLSASVKSVRSQRDPARRVTVKGKNDELTNLANEINDMLATLQQSHNKLQITNEKLDVVGKLTRHDIRNKLSIIVNNVYLAKQKLKGDTNAIEYLDNIDSAIDQMDKILNFSKTFETVGVEELAYIDLKKVAQELVMFLGLSNIKFVNELDGLTLLADSLLQQILFNLIDDTVKHGEKVGQIRVYYEVGKHELKLIYEDDGVGISEAEKELIFNEGYGKGTGYGLYLIRKICQAYGWTIQETGLPNKGVHFIITIPEMNKNGKNNYYIK